MIKYIAVKDARNLLAARLHQTALNNEEIDYVYEDIVDNRLDIWLNEIPAADVAEVRHGRWEHDGYDFPHGNDWVHCSVCGKRGINVPADLTPYCPNCGAKMDEEECLNEK